MPRRLRTEAVQIHRETVRDRIRDFRELTSFRRTHYPVMPKYHLVRFYLELVHPKRLRHLRTRLKSVFLRTRHHELALAYRSVERARETPQYRQEVLTINKRRFKRYQLIAQRERYMVESLRQALIRARPVFRPLIDLIQAYIFKLRAMDQTLDTLEPTLRESVINRLIEVAKGNKLFKQEVLQQPLLRYFAKRYILYYQEHPNTHNVYALRLSPYMLMKAQNRNMQYYVMRVFDAMKLKMNAVVGMAKKLAMQIYRYFVKRGGEWVNSLTYSSYGPGSRTDTIVLSRDSLLDPIESRKLYDVVFRPHEIKRVTSKMLGMREMYYEIRDPGVYAMVERRTRIAKLYDSGAYKRLIMGMQRRRFKEILARNIL